MRRRKRIREEAGNPFRFALGILFLVSGIFVSQTAAAQGAPESDEPAPEYAPGPDAPPYAPEPLPRTLTLAAGTVISVRTTQFLSSDQNRAGDGFGAELEQPLVVDGWVVARRGQTVLGRVVMAQKAGRVKGVSQLAVEVTHLVMVDGNQIPVRTEFMQTSGGISQGRDAHLFHISFLNPAWEPSDVRHHLYSCGYERDEDALEVETQWVRNKTSPFSSLLMPR